MVPLRPRLAAVVALVACLLAPLPLFAQDSLRLATTTSTQDSGLLDAILPDFERACSCRVGVIAVGTGQALEIGRRGDADVLLVHSRKAEDQFVAEGHGRAPLDVMYNDFVLVGPAGDPAKVAGSRLAREALAAIARAAAPFASRGDRSGTHVKEQELWAAAKAAPGPPWYRSLGQGMGETLMFAQEQQAYALTDRATWLALQGKLPALRVLLGGATPAGNTDPGLRNEYRVIAVNPDKHPGINAPLARRFVEWLLSAPVQRAIGDFGVSRFGQALYHPNAGAGK